MYDPSTWISRCVPFPTVFLYNQLDQKGRKEERTDRRTEGKKEEGIEGRRRERVKSNLKFINKTFHFKCMTFYVIIM